MPQTRARLTNEDVADLLDRVADLLKAQDANPFRVRAYRDAAAIARARQTPLADVLDERGLEGLEDLPGIGKSLASAIREILHTGKLGMLERLQGEVTPEAVFRSVPGIGGELARRIHETLNLETLEELEEAAHDGRLEEVDGFGDRRLRAVRESLASMLGRETRRRALTARDREGQTRNPGRWAQGDRPTVQTLLEVDREYREKAAAGKLRRIAPKRFNPTGRAWLPIYHTEKDGWSFTALFSNTARAHELQRTQDWVVLYFERDGRESRGTVVTAHQGDLKGKRVVRGREEECRDHYANR